MKLSQWHDGSVKPVHVGTYETTSEGGSYQYWDGKFWGWCHSTIGKHVINSVSEYQIPQWRGIVKDKK